MEHCILEKGGWGRTLEHCILGKGGGTGGLTALKGEGALFTALIVVAEPLPKYF